MPGGSRIVFDLAKPVRIDKAFVIDASVDAPARLVLDLVATDRESFLRKIALDSRLTRPEAPSAGRPQTNGGDPRPLVVLDPGHGGIDTGTKAPSGELEKDIVLDFAQRLRDRIEKSGKYRVVMTRSDDTFVPLADRVHIARNAGAALFVSIHADALPHGEGDAQGASVYTLSETASDSEAARLAEKENRADVIAGVDLKTEPDDVAGILIDLAQRETKSFSVQFAHKLVARNEGGGATAQESAEIGRVPGVAGAGRAFGAGRARLCLQSAGSAVAAVRPVAQPHGGFDRAGDRRLFRHPRRRRACRRELRFRPMRWLAAMASV